jgi:hypothetical protein
LQSLVHLSHILLVVLAPFWFRLLMDLRVEAARELSVETEQQIRGVAEEEISLLELVEMVVQAL